jgi:hypothetical protein
MAGQVRWARQHDFCSVAAAPRRLDGRSGGDQSGLRDGCPFVRCGRRDGIPYWATRSGGGTSRFLPSEPSLVGHPGVDSLWVRLHKSA